MQLPEPGVTPAKDERGSVFGPASLLVCGRTAALAATFLVPVIFARIFTPAQFGTYKQLFLIHATIVALAELGMAESLYYFVPSEPARAGRYAANSILALTAAGTVCLVSVGAASRSIARWLGNPALDDPLPLLGWYLALTLASASFEIILIARGRHPWASGVYALSGIARAAFMLAPVLLKPSLESLLAGAIGFAALRLAGLLACVRREFGAELRPDAGRLRRQLTYSLPLQLAVCLEVVQSNFHYYVVSRRFDPATFAAYTIGCLQIPLIDVIAGSACSVMMVKMSERIRDGQPEAILGLWSDTTRKLALIFLPFLGLLFAASGDLIPLLFTNAYAASIPVFRVWLLVLFFATFQPHGVLRVYGRTRFLAAQNMLKLLVVVGLIGRLVSAFHLAGAVLVAALAALLGKGLSLLWMKRAGKIRVRDLLPWGSLAANLAATAAACALALALRSRLGLSPLPALLATSTAYAVAYASLAWRFGLLTASEKRRALEFVHRWTDPIRRHDYARHARAKDSRMGSHT